MLPIEAAPAANQGAALAFLDVETVTPAAEGAWPIEGPVAGAFQVP